MTEGLVVRRGGVDAGRESAASNILTATNFPIATHSDPYTI
jgi:hypothetical protein